MIYRRAARHFDYLLLSVRGRPGRLRRAPDLQRPAQQLPGRRHAWPIRSPSNCIFAGLGLGITFAVAWLDYRIFGQMAVGLYAIAILMLIAVLFIGDSVYGSRRWFNFAGQQVQASEIAKLFVIIALARYLADRQAAHP